MIPAKLNKEQIAFKKKMSKPWLLRLFLLSKIPLGFLSGMKVIHLDQDKAVSTVGYKWLNRNPFKSMYFGVQNMAAELSTGAIALMAVQGQQPSIAGIITGSEARFHKQAKSRVYFTCGDGKILFEAVEACRYSDQGKEVTVHADGRTADGTLVSEFKFTWSFKKRG